MCIINPLYTNYICGYDYMIIKPMITIMIIFIIFMIGYYIIFKRRLGVKVLFGLLCIELFTSTYLDFNATTRFSNITMADYHAKERALGQPNELSNFLKQYDEEPNEFYRLYVPKDSYAKLGVNQNLYYGYADISSYDSTYNYANGIIADMVKDKSLVQEHAWSYDITDINLIDFTSAKYAILPENTEVNDNSLKFITNYKYYKVYRNIDYIPLAKTYNSIISMDEYMNIKDTKLIKDNIIASNNDLPIISKYIKDNTISNAYNIHKDINTMSLSIDTNDTSFAVISLGYNEGMTITNNGNKIDYYNVNGGFIGIPLNKGNNEIILSFKPKGLNTGILLTIVGSIILVIIYKKQHSYGSFQYKLS